MPTQVQHLVIEGKSFVLLPATEYEKLCGRAGSAIALDESDLPPLPKPNRKGQFPALEYTRVSLARDIIRDRRAAGLTQQQLADLSGVRQETVSRVESGKHTPSTTTIDKLDRALKRAAKQKK